MEVNLKVLFIQLPHTEASSGGKVITERNKNFLKLYFGSENVYLADDLGISFRGYKDIGYESKVQKLIDEYGIDIIFLDNSLLGPFSRTFYKTNVVFCFFHNVEQSYFMQQKNLTFKERIVRRLIIHSEKTTVSSAKTLITINGRDSKELLELYGRGADFVLHSSMEDGYNTPTKAEIFGNYILFIGADFFGNTDGLFPFIEEVMPNLPCKLKVVGNGMEKYAQKYDNHYNTSFQGFTEDLGELYHGATAVVMPIISGSGMKTKTCEALMYGKKIFGTPEAFEGYEGLNEQDCVVCDNNAEFLRKIKQFLAGGAECFSVHNRNTFLKHYSNETTYTSFQSFMDARISQLTDTHFIAKGEEDFHVIRNSACTVKPDISVIMPVYNTHDYLESSIESILSQTFRNFELIIVDDGSTDRCLETVMRLAEGDERIRVYAQKHAGQGIARNNAIKIAEGKWICFVDSDDTIPKESLYSRLEVASKNKLDTLFFSGSDLIIKHSYADVMRGKEFFAQAVKNLDYWTGPCLYFCNAAFIQANGICFEEGVYHEDAGFVFDMIMKSARIGVNHRVLYYRNYRADSTTAMQYSVSHVKGLLRYYEHLKNYLDTETLGHKERRILADETRSVLHTAYVKSKSFSRLEMTQIRRSIPEPEWQAFVKQSSMIYYVNRAYSAFSLWGFGAVKNIVGRVISRGKVGSQ